MHCPWNEGFSLLMRDLVRMYEKGLFWIFFPYILLKHLCYTTQESLEETHYGSTILPFQLMEFLFTVK